VPTLDAIGPVQGQSLAYGPPRPGFGIIARMLFAQALVERGLIAGFIDSLGAALMQVDYYVGQGNTKWALLGLAVVLGWIFLKPRR
jgi:hypothetical protein